MPLISTTQFTLPGFGEGAYFNGSTAEMSRVNDGIITDTASLGFASCWVQLPPISGPTAAWDSFIFGATIVGAGDWIEYAVGQGFSAGASYLYNNHSISYRDAPSNQRVQNVSYSAGQDTAIRSSMQHLVINKGSPGSSVAVYLNGAFLGNTTLGYSIGSSPVVSPTTLVVGATDVGGFNTEGAIKNLVFSSSPANLAVAANLYSVGIDGDPTTVNTGSPGDFTITAWYPFKTDFDDASGNGKHFTSVTDVILRG